MSVSTQRGIALVQVLLISMVLMLLVVQLSSKANNAVEIATELKYKAKAELQIQSTFTDYQYALLTQDKSDYLIQLNEQNILFTSQETGIGNHTKVAVQDMAGLLSSSFFTAEWQSYLGGDSAKVDYLKSWQGIEAQSVSVGIKRNARLPYVEEINLLKGFENVDLSYVTHLPTGFFNMATAPLGLVEKVYGNDIANQLKALRSEYNFNRNTLNGIKGLEEASAFPPGEFSRIYVSVNIENSDRRMLSRGRYYLLQPGNPIPLLELGLTTP